MIRSAITVSLVEEARGGPFVLWDGLESGFRKAAELGFDAIEIFPPEPAALHVDQIRRWMDQHRLAVAAVGTGAGWVRKKLTLSSPDLAVSEAARAFVRQMIDVGAALGAPAIIGSMQGRWGDGVSREEILARLAEALEDLGEHARGRGQRLIYEPLNRYETNLINTVAEGVRFLDSLTTKNVRLLADLFHMNIEEANLPSALMAGGSHIGHIHFVDTNRRAVGLGHFDMGPIAAAIRHMEFDGYLSAEAFPLPDAREAAQRTISAFRHYFPRDAA